jgi:putative endonuclease
MSFFVYLLANKKNKRITTYVGYTNNLKKRLKLHNDGKGAKFTRGRKWKVIYYEKFVTKKEAISREYYIKKNRKFRNLIKKKFNEKKYINITTL